MLARIINLLCHVELFLATQQLQQDPNPHDIEFWNRIAKEHVNRKLKANPHLLAAKRPKNVILFIGDGMGISTVTSARINKNQKAGNPYLNDPLFFEKFQTAGLVKVDSKTLGLMPKSGAVCTKERNLHITDGIAEGALQKGLEVGFVTTARITHATPGALYAKGIQRDIEYDGVARNLGAVDCDDIAKQLLSYPASEFKVMMGGGAHFLMEKSRGGMRGDGMNIDHEWSKLGGRRRVLSDVENLQAITASNEKLLGLFAGSHLPMYLEEQMAGRTTTPRLSEMTVKAIEQLQHEENGFFLMVEGGNIDIAEHANQMHLAFAEVYEFEEAIRKARETTNSSETLIIVTADHGHALTLPGYLPIEKSLFSSDIATPSTSKEEYKYEVPGLFFATGPGSRGSLKMDSVINEENGADPLYRQPAAVPMLYGAHGGEDVGIWADGPLSDLFSSSLENTQVAYIIKYLLCLRSVDHTFCNASMYTEPSQKSGFVRDVVESLGPEFLVLCGIFLLVVAVLSLSTAVFVIGFLFLQNRRSLRDLQCTSESTLVKSPL